MAALLLLRSADISTAFVSASILPDFASVFTSLFIDLETDLELTDILFVLLREQILKIKAINARFVDRPVPKITLDIF